MHRSLAPLRWPLAACLGALLPSAVVLLGGRTLVWRDTAQLYAPHRPAIVEALRGLRLPAWNPFEATGQPLFAQGLHSVLHPVSLAVAAFTSSTDALLAALLAAAALGTWVAARTLGCSPAAAAGAAFAYALSGFVLAMTANQVFLVGAASGPWAIAGLQAAARRPGGLVAGCAAVAALALSGDVGGLGAFVLAGAALALSTGGWRGLARAGAAAALGVALAAVQLLPSWRYLAETSRGAGLLDPGSLHRWALAPWRLLELAAPGFFVGVPASYTAPLAAVLGGETASPFPFSSSVFVGAPVLLLAVAGARGRGPARWLLGLAALFLWLALGHRAGSQAALAGVPVWGALRYWEKMVGPLSLCLALAAGAGIDAVLRGEQALVRRGAVAGAALSAAGLLSLAAGGAPFGLAGSAAGLARGHLLVGLAHAAAGLVALRGLMLLMKRWPQAGAPGLAALLFLQSAAASPFALHAGSREALAARPPALAAAPPGPRLVAPLGFDFLEGRGGLDAIDLLQQQEGRAGRPSTNALARVDSLATYTGLTSLRWEMVIGAGPLFWPLARRFGTTHVLSRPPAGALEQQTLQAATRGATAFEAFDEGALLAWEVPHRPWASFAPAVRAAPSREAAGALLGDELVAGGDAVIVESGVPLAASPGRVLSISRAAEVVELEAESAGPAVLVVGDAFAPGWEAALDGRAAALLPADVLVRAVAWPAGRHRLSMRYVPPGLQAGAAISALALAAVAALAWRARRAAARQEQAT